MRISRRKYPLGTVSKILSARVPVPLLNQLDMLCSETGRSRSDVLNQILQEYFKEK